MATPVETVVGIAAVKLITKFDEETVIANPEVVLPAINFIRAYSGDFEFLASLREQSLKPGRTLSPRQLSGALNCMLAEARRQAKVAAPVAVATPTNAKAIHDGYYTIVLEDGSHVTLRVKKATFAEEKDLQVVAYLSGSDNESSYTGVGFLKGNQLRIWKRFTGATRIIDAIQVLLTATGDEQKELGKAYAMESGRCYVCSKLLTDPLSISLGIGPICRGD